MVKLKGTYRDHSRDNALNFHKIRDCLHFGNGIRCMNLTLKGIEKICPPLITKRHWLQTDNQPTVGGVGSNVTGNHNIRQHDSLYILVE